MWRVPPAWGDRAAFILGGGPSLLEVDLEALKGRGAVIAINNAHEIAPWADVLFWADAQWLMWNKREVARFTGTRISREPPPNWEPLDFEFHQLDREMDKPLSHDPSKVAGYCGGGSALNLAYLYGAKRIALLGFDMKPTGQWHNKHKLPSKAELYLGKFVPALQRMAPELKAAGVEVINCTPGSALDCFPIMPIGELPW